MENNNKAVIKDKVELERIIDFYLGNDLSLSILEDQYALTYPQREFLLQKSMGYSRQQDYLVEDYEKTDIANTYLEIPHVIEEDYPLSTDEQKDLFRKLESIDKDHIVKRLNDVNDELSRVKTAISRIMFKYNNDMQLCDYIKKYKGEDNLKEALLSNGIKESKIESILDVNKNLSELMDTKWKLTQARDELLRKRRELIDNNIEYARIIDTLVKTNVKLVNWVIREFFKNIPLPKEEAQGFGLLALGKAINRFDLSYDCNFSTYATKVISSEIKRNFKSLMGYTWKTYCMKLNIAHWREELLNMDKERTRPYTPQELADSGLVKYTARQIADLDKSVDVMYNYSDYYEEPDDSEVISKRMPCFQSDYDYLDAIDDMEGIPFDLSNIEVAPYVSLRKEAIYGVLGELDQRSQKILDLRYGLTNGEEMTLEAIGKELFISRDRVRQIEAKALRRLRDPRRRKKILAFAEEFIQYTYYEPRPSIDDYVEAFMRLYDLRKRKLSYKSKAFFLSNRKLNLDEEEVCKMDMLMEAFLINMQLDSRDAYPINKIISIFTDYYGRDYDYKYPYRYIYEALNKKYLKELEDNGVEFERKEKTSDALEQIHLALTMKC